jgi:hypothetical protein
MISLESVPLHNYWADREMLNVPQAQNVTLAVCMCV